MRKLMQSVFSLVVLCLSASFATAEKPDLPPEKLRELATHVVTGEVTAIFAREPERVGRYDRTYYVAEVKVATCEKGEGIMAESLVYIRYWRQAWAGPGPVAPGTSGHRGLPEQGSKMRIYLARNAYDGFTRDNTDGGLNVIGANGFEALDDE